VKGRPAAEREWAQVIETARSAGRDRSHDLRAGSVGEFGQSSVEAAADDLGLRGMRDEPRPVREWCSATSGPGSRSSSSITWCL